MRFWSTLFAGLAAQTVFAGVPVTPPSKPGLRAVDTGLTVIEGVSDVVKVQGKLVVDFAEDGVVPICKTSLSIIAQQAESIKKTFEAYAIYVVQPLVEDELSDVLSVVEETQILVEDIKEVLKDLLAAGTREFLKAVATEIRAVLATVKPFVTPVVELCEGLTGPSTSGSTAKTIKTALKDLRYTTYYSLEPIKDAVAKLN